MLALGILPEGEPVELVDGVLVQKDRGGGDSVHGPAHAVAVARLARLDRRLEPFGLHLRTQLPITLSEVDEPEPDGVIVRGHLEDFVGSHPRPASVLIAFEVSDSTLAYDRGTKARLYAAAGIPTYVIVNLAAQRLELHEDPVTSEARYAVARPVERGQVLVLRLGADTLEVPAADLLPAPT